ncbi:hypothetical protein HELRODRAFT_167104 [Helobdella robusta]|uniref:Uncharacterized protein n=1 Tax=Helobdella robusta TaxID=6412 RepID=T1EZ09_HELRO|nr:hypothetical protein HELRODRAFT_167104 [Helobdella robusta]ESO10599.1 hypothetical protein HELRODRAFT_167104 [Helobdella robusta]
MTGFESKELRIKFSVNKKNAIFWIAEKRKYYGGIVSYKERKDFTRAVVSTSSAFALSYLTLYITNMDRQDLLSNLSQNKQQQQQQSMKSQKVSSLSSDSSSSLSSSSTSSARAEQSKADQKLSTADQKLNTADQKLSKADQKLSTAKNRQSSASKKTAVNVAKSNNYNNNNNNNNYNNNNNNNNIIYIGLIYEPYYDFGSVQNVASVTIESCACVKDNKKLSDFSIFIGTLSFKRDVTFNELKKSLKLCYKYTGRPFKKSETKTFACLYGFKTGRYTYIVKNKGYGPISRKIIQSCNFKFVKKTSTELVEVKTKQENVKEISSAKFPVVMDYYDTSSWGDVDLIGWWLMTFKEIFKVVVIRLIPLDGQQDHLRGVNICASMERDVNNPTTPCRMRKKSSTFFCQTGSKEAKFVKIKGPGSEGGFMVKSLSVIEVVVDQKRSKKIITQKITIESLSPHYKNLDLKPSLQYRFIFFKQLNADNMGWWMIELDGKYKITELRITSGLARNVLSELQRLIISTSDNPPQKFHTSPFHLRLKQCQKVNLKKQVDPNKMKRFVCLPEPVQGRYVVIITSANVFYHVSAITKIDVILEVKDGFHALIQTPINDRLNARPTLEKVKELWYNYNCFMVVSWQERQELGYWIMDLVYQTQVDSVAISVGKNPATMNLFYIYVGEDIYQPINQTFQICSARLGKRPSGERNQKFICYLGAQAGRYVVLMRPFGGLYALSLLETTVVYVWKSKFYTVTYSHGPPPTITKPKFDPILSLFVNWYVCSNFLNGDDVEADGSWKVDLRKSFTIHGVWVVAGKNVEVLKTLQNFIITATESESEYREMFATEICAFYLGSAPTPSSKKFFKCYPRPVLGRYVELRIRKDVLYYNISAIAELEIVVHHMNTFRIVKTYQREHFENKKIGGKLPKWKTNVLFSKNTNNNSNTYYRFFLSQKIIITGLTIHIEKAISVKRLIILTSNSQQLDNTTRICTYFKSEKFLPVKKSSKIRLTCSTRNHKNRYVFLLYTVTPESEFWFRKIEIFILDREKGYVATNGTAWWMLDLGSTHHVIYVTVTTSKHFEKLLSLIDKPIRASRVIGAEKFISAVLDNNLRTYAIIGPDFSGSSWIEIDFGEMFSVFYVEIFNSPDKTSVNSGGFTISIKPSGPCDPRQIIVCACERGKLSRSQKKMYQCQPRYITGRYLIISKTSGLLVIAEVRIYGKILDVFTHSNFTMNATKTTNKNNTKNATTSLAMSSSISKITDNKTFANLIATENTSSMNISKITIRKEAKYSIGVEVRLFGAVIAGQTSIMWLYIKLGASYDIYKIILVTGSNFQTVNDLQGVSVSITNTAINSNDKPDQITSTKCFEVPNSPISAKSKIELVCSPKEINGQYIIIYKKSGYIKLGAISSFEITILVNSAYYATIKRDSKYSIGVEVKLFGIEIAGQKAIKWFYVKLGASYSIYKVILLTGTDSQYQITSTKCSEVPNKQISAKSKIELVCSPKEINGQYIIIYKKSGYIKLGAISYFEITIFVNSAYYATIKRDSKYSIGVEVKLFGIEIAGQKAITWFYVKLGASYSIYKIILLTGTDSQYQITSTKCSEVPNKQISAKSKIELACSPKEINGQYIIIYKKFGYIKLGAISSFEITILVNSAYYAITVEIPSQLTRTNSSRNISINVSKTEESPQWLTFYIVVVEWVKEVEAGYWVFDLSKELDVVGVIVKIGTECSDFGKFSIYVENQVDVSSFSKVCAKYDKTDLTSGALKTITCDSATVRGRYVVIQKLSGSIKKTCLAKISIIFKEGGQIIEASQSVGNEQTSKNAVPKSESTIDWYIEYYEFHYNLDYKGWWRFDLAISYTVISVAVTTGTDNSGEDIKLMELMFPNNISEHFKKLRFYFHTALQAFQNFVILVSQDSQQNGKFCGFYKGKNKLASSKRYLFSCYKVSGRYVVIVSQNNNVEYNLRALSCVDIIVSSGFQSFKYEVKVSKVTIVPPSTRTNKWTYGFVRIDVTAPEITFMGFDLGRSCSVFQVEILLKISISITKLGLFVSESQEFKDFKRTCFFFGKSTATTVNSRTKMKFQCSVPGESKYRYFYMMWTISEKAVEWFESITLLLEYQGSYYIVNVSRSEENPQWLIYYIVVIEWVNEVEAGYWVFDLGKELEVIGVNIKIGPGCRDMNSFLVYVEKKIDSNTQFTKICSKYGKIDWIGGSSKVITCDSETNLRGRYVIIQRSTGSIRRTCILKFCVLYRDNNLVVNGSLEIPAAKPLPDTRTDPTITIDWFIKYFEFHYELDYKGWWIFDVARIQTVCAVVFLTGSDSNAMQTLVNFVILVSDTKEIISRQPLAFVSPSKPQQCSSYRGSSLLTTSKRYSFACLKTSGRYVSIVQQNFNVEFNLRSLSSVEIVTCSGSSSFKYIIQVSKIYTASMTITTVSTKWIYTFTRLDFNVPEYTVFGYDFGRACYIHLVVITLNGSTLFPF